MRELHLHPADGVALLLMAVLMAVTVVLSKVIG